MTTERSPIFALDPEQYDAHPLHAPEREWRESNCYIDLWVEILHALDLEVEACLPFTLAQDFEGDQWTFYKPRPAELAMLYGIEVEELAMWRALVDHCAAQVDAGHLPLVEVDSFYLPDTRATDYRTNHVKTTIGITAIDVQRKSLRYFHNAGFYALEGEDFDGVFRLDRETPEDYLPPYAEIAKVDRLIRRSPSELRERSIALLRRYLARRPAVNPFRVYAGQVQDDLAYLIEQGEEVYHRYIFATVRQCGSGFDFTARYLAWLADGDLAGYDEVAGVFARISDTAKMLILKTARVVHGKKLRDVRPNVEAMADAWDEGIAQLTRLTG